MTNLDDDDRPEPLARLADGPTAPSGLEERVVRELRRRGALRGELAPRTVGSRRRWLGGLAALAAAVLTFLIGRETAPGASPSREPRWLVLLYEDGSYRGPAPAERAGRVEEYRQWGARVGALDGAELGPDAALVGEAIGATGAPDVTPLGRIAGYFVIAAATLDQARTYAAACPHLKYGGRVVIRPMSPA